MRFSSLATLVLCALPCAAPDAASLRDLLDAVRPEQRAPGASQPQVELPEQIKTAADVRFKTPLFTFVRIRYTQRDESNTIEQWVVDYPDADAALSEFVAHATGLTTDSRGRIFELTEPTLGQYPFIYVAEAGHLELADDEVAALRSYLLGGGFVMADDFWGEDDWAHLSAQFRKVFPEHEIVELPADHEIFRSYFEIDAKPPVPGIRDVMLNDADGTPLPQASYYGLIGGDGRLMAIFCHNADFGDGWEHAADVGYPLASSFGQAIPMGINIVVYALSH